jgi:hypothetical protein
VHIHINSRYLQAKKLIDDRVVVKLQLRALGQITPATPNTNLGHFSIFCSGNDRLNPDRLVIYGRTMHSLLTAMQPNSLVTRKASFLRRVSTDIACQSRTLMGRKSNGGFVLLIRVPSKRLVESELISVDVDLFTVSVGVMTAQKRHTGDLSALDRAIHTSS